MAIHQRQLPPNPGPSLLEAYNTDDRVQSVGAAVQLVATKSVACKDIFCQLYDNVQVCVFAPRA